MTGTFLTPPESFNISSSLLSIRLYINVFRLIPIDRPGLIRKGSARLAIDDNFSCHKHLLNNDEL